MDYNMCTAIGGEYCRGEKLTWMLTFLVNFIRNTAKPWDNVNSDEFWLWALILHPRGGI